MSKQESGRQEIYEASHGCLSPIPAREEPMLADLAQQIRHNALEQGIKTGRKEGISIAEAYGILKDKQIILKKTTHPKFHIKPDQLQLIDHCSTPEKLDKPWKKS